MVCMYKWIVRAWRLAWAPPANQPHTRRKAPRRFILCRSARVERASQVRRQASIGTHVGFGAVCVVSSSHISHTQSAERRFSWSGASVCELFARASREPPLLASLPSGSDSRLGAHHIYSPYIAPAHRARNVCSRAVFAYQCVSVRVRV